MGILSVGGKPNEDLETHLTQLTQVSFFFRAPGMRKKVMLF